MSLVIYMVVGYYGAALLHEWAHAVVGELLGVPLRGFRFSWGSIAIVRRAGGPLSNLVISAAGPVLSLFLAWLLWPYSHLFGVANFCLGAINLIPIRNSDGDRILSCMAALGWIADPAHPRDGLATSHAWLQSRGFSEWDLGRMELAAEHPAAPGLLSLPKMESNIYMSRPVTRNSGNL